MSALRVVRHLRDLPTVLRGGAFALGNFDGVHPGHRAVIAAARDAAARRGAPTGVITFEPHPRAVFRPDQPAFRLTPLRLKLEALAALGIDMAVVLRFSPALAAVSAERFVRLALVEQLAARVVAVGHDFHFGSGRGGDPNLLARLGLEFDYETIIVSAQRGTDGVFSSTAIREALLAGDIDTASRLLGRAYRVSARVRHGDKRGRLLGYPTANLVPTRQLLPANGIYAVRATVAGKTHDAVASLGTRPTFAGADRRLEVHLFDFAGDLYGQRMDVDFAAYLRAEAKFDGVEALIRQMDADARAAREALARQ